MILELTPTLLTSAGVARELRCAPETLKRRIASGAVLPDFVLVETVGNPGSLLFKSDRLPEIALAITQKEKA